MVGQPDDEHRFLDDQRQRMRRGEFAAANAQRRWWNLKLRQLHAYDHRQCHPQQHGVRPGGRNGGGIALGTNYISTFQMTGSVVEGNQAEGRGGGLYFTQFVSGGPTISDSAINNNVAADRGGGVYTSNLTLQRSVVADNHTTGATARGGGVFASNIVTVADSLVSGNYTLGESARGGGIYATTGNTASQGIVRSTISNNYTVGMSADGGGLYFTGRFDIVDSTLSGNQTFGELAHGGGGNTREVFATRSTIARNSVVGDAASGGGLFARGSVALDSSIVALNEDALSPSDMTTTSQVLAYYSFVGDTTGINAGGINPVLGTGNLVNQDPRLGPLAYNGGKVFVDGSRVPTHALLVDSPAIDTGNPTAMAGISGVPVYDERGTPFGRIVNGDGLGTARLDMGAYERQPNPLAGDYNFDGAVNAGDYTVWRDTLGATNDPRADGSGVVVGVPDGVVDGYDYEFWKSRFGNVLGQGAGSGEQGEGEVSALAEPVAHAASVFASQPATERLAGGWCGGA